MCEYSIATNSSILQQQQQRSTPTYGKTDPYNDMTIDTAAHSNNDDDNSSLLRTANSNVPSNVNKNSSFACIGDGSVVANRQNITVEVVIVLAYWCLPCLNLIDQVKSFIMPWIQNFRHYHYQSPSTSYCDSNSIYISCSPRIRWIDASQHTSIVVAHHIDRVPTMFLRDLATNQEIPQSRIVGSPSDENMVKYVMRLWEQILIQYLEGNHIKYSRLKFKCGE